MILSAILIGYLLGSFQGDSRVIVVLFVLGVSFTYYLHDKGFVTGGFRG